MKKEIRACLIASLATSLDPCMEKHGFKRGKTSLVYKRQLGEATQIIDLSIQVHPKDNPNAAAAVYPRMEVLMPAVDRVLKDMIEDNLSLLEGVTGGTSKQPIGFTSVKEHPGRWFVYQPDSVPDIVDGIRMFIERWTIPFLDAYSTPQDIIATDERDDQRLPRDRAQMMRVVAASLVCNRRDYAQTRMEKRLGALGARRRYQQVFDYIQQVHCAVLEPMGATQDPRRVS